MRELLTKNKLVNFMTERFGKIDCYLMARFYSPTINDRSGNVRAYSEFFVVIQEEVTDPLTDEKYFIDSPYSIKKQTINFNSSELDLENILESISEKFLEDSFELSYSDWK